MIKHAVLSAMRRLGYDLVLFNNTESEREHLEIYEAWHVCTSSAATQRTYVLIDATRYIVRNEISGAFVECGVFKGGLMMAVALALMAEGVTDRDSVSLRHLCRDAGARRTRRGSPGSARLPNIRETPDFRREFALDALLTRERRGGDGVDPLSSGTHPPGSRHGRRDDSGAGADRNRASAAGHGLVSVYDARIGASTSSSDAKGVAIVDDYGHFKGARDATDEYFRQRGLSPLQRIDYTARMLLKQDGE